MKALSIILRVVALLAAAFCIFAWVDTRQKVSYALGKMSNVEGESLQDKADKVPGILDDNAGMKKQISALGERIKGLDTMVSGLNSELESERSKSLKASAELAKKTSEIRTLNQTITSNKKSMAEKDSMIEGLKAEVLKAKSMVTQDKTVDGLKEKIASLESQLEAKHKAFLEADKKTKILDMSEIVEVIETNKEGQKVRKQIVKVPYIPKGDIATVLSVDHENQLVELNRGQKNGVKLDQVIVLRREGEDVSEIKIAELSDDKSVGMINRLVAIPETIEVGDSLEMCNPAIEKLQNGGDVPAKDAEQAPSAPSAPAAPSAPQAPEAEA